MSCPLILCQTTINLGGKCDQRIGDFNGIGHARFEFAQSLGQAFQIMSGPRSDLGQCRGRTEAAAVFHDWFDQLLARM